MNLLDVAARAKEAQKETGMDRRQWDDYAEQARTQLPAAPEALLDGYVRWAPWIAIIFGILGLLALLVLLGVLTFLSPALLLGGAAAVESGAGAFLTIVVGLVLSVLELVGGNLMRKRSATGWWILAIGIAVGAVSNLLHLAILGLVLSLAVAYIHLSVKPRYQ